MSLWTIHYWQLIETIILSSIAGLERKMKVLIAIDDAECSEAAVQCIADKTCCESNMQIKLITVIEPIHSEYAVTGLYFESLLRAQGQYKEERQDLLARKKAALEKARPGLKIETALIEGPVANSIIEEAEKWKADLLIVGSHGRTGMERFLLGSVAEQLVIHAPCSVEVVKVRKTLPHSKNQSELQIAV